MVGTLLNELYSRYYSLVYGNKLNEYTLVGIRY